MPVKITSKYTPLTYDEITKPLIQATEAQMAVENAYMDAQDKASAAMAQANQETDPIAYSKLKSYAEDLQAQADSLMRYGLQRSSRQSLLNMRRRYGEEITPIAAAIERRNALSEEQRKLEAANPYLRHERDMRTVSLDAMLDNPNMDYGRSIDLSDVQKRAATLVKAMGQGRTDVKYGKQLDRYTKEVLMREGFTPEEIQAALSNDDNANQALSAALDNLYTSTGADSFRAGVDTEVWDAIQQGAMMGAGEVKATIHADEEAKRRDFIADRNHSEAFQREMANLRKTKVNSDGSVDIPEGQLERSMEKDEAIGGYVYKTPDGMYLLEGKGNKKYKAPDQDRAKEVFEKDSKKLKFLRDYTPIKSKEDAGMYLQGDSNPEVVESKKWDKGDATSVQYQELPENIKDYYKGVCEQYGIDPYDMVYEKDEDWFGETKYRMYNDPQYKSTHPNYNKKINPADFKD